MRSETEPMADHSGFSETKLDDLRLNDEMSLLRSVKPNQNQKSILPISTISKEYSDPFERVDNAEQWEEEATEETHQVSRSVYILHFIDHCDKVENCTSSRLASKRVLKPSILRI